MEKTKDSKYKKPVKVKKILKKLEKSNPNKHKHDIPIKMDIPGANGPMVTSKKLRRNRKDGHINGEGKCD